MAVIKHTQKPTFREISGRFAKANDQLLADKREMMRGLGRRFVSIAQRHAPKRTGEFAAGIRYRTTIGGDTVSFTASVPQPLGTWIIGGTRPHVITPRGPGYPLRFEVGGQVVYAYRVNHPGTAPNPFIRRAYEEWKPAAQVEMRRISTRWTTTVSG